MINVNYDAIGSLVPFHESPARVRIVKGPIGSGKSTAMVFELLRLACEQVPDPRDGIRRTKMLIVRNTLPQLIQTCLATIFRVLRPLVNWHPSSNSILFKFGDIETEWLLLPLDRPQNIQRLLSLEVTCAWVSEAREVPPDVVKQVLSRCGRFPDRDAGGITRWCLIAESNSFRTDSPWYELIEENLPKNWQFFNQPGARSGEADWLDLLDADYYPSLIESASEEWIEQYIDNKYGDSLDGQAVFKNSFKLAFHVSKFPLVPSWHHPLIIGLDFARHPAATFHQVDNRGRMLLLGELDSGGNMGILKFIDELLFPLLMTERYRGIPLYAVGDPSGRDRGQIGEESVFDILKKRRIPAYPANTNFIAPRLRAVERFLLQQRDGGPAFIIDPSCKLAIAGFSSRYRFKIRASGQLDDTTPDKIRPWADIQDAIQYACLGTSERIQTRALAAFNAHATVKAPPVGAWT